MGRAILSISTEPARSTNIYSIEDETGDYHNGKAIASVVMNVIDDVGLLKTNGIITDGESNMNVGRRKISNQFDHRHIVRP